MKARNPVKYSVIILLSFCSPFLLAQRNAERGDKYFDQNLFEDAIKCYQLDLKSGHKKTSEHSMRRIADCYRIMGEFEKAEATYKKIVKKKKKDPVNYLNYGLSLKNSAKYAEAILQFQEYITLKPEDPMGKIFLMSCDSAQKWLDETIGKEVKNLEKINTELSEFGPAFCGPNKIFFSSSRIGSKKALISFDGGGDVHRMDLYNIDIHSIENNVEEKKDVINFKEMNTPLHEGSACFSKDGKEIYFTKTVKGKRNKDNNILNTLQVFYSKIDSSGNWTKPVSAFAFNSANYSVGHPSLSYDGQTIFYMSDKPGGFGKTDIYYSIKKADGTWGNPINAGNAVNTFGHEMFPYISQSGNLYFSSNAHPGMGQLDIFKATQENGKWISIQNLKPPVNSIGNDFGIAYDGLNNRGFFSSDRFNGKGNEDIYSFSEDIPLNLSIVKDSLFFSDASLFDDIKYKLETDSNKKEITFTNINGIYGLSLENISNVKLTAVKNGMPYNSILLNFVKNQDQQTANLEFTSSDKTIAISGNLYRETEISLHTNETAAEENKTIKSGENGDFNIDQEIIPQNKYTMSWKL